MVRAVLEHVTMPCFGLSALICIMGLAAAPVCALASEVPYVPTPMAVVDAMLSLAAVGPADTVYDLGSGDGRIVIEAAKRYSARAVGIERDAGLVAQSQAAARQAGVADRATFLRQDIFLADFRHATVVTLYLLPDVNLQLRPRILSELSPGTRIVSHDWDMGDWPPDRTLVIEVPEKPTGGTPESLIYLWTVPAHLAGTWRGTLTSPQGTETAELQIVQWYQHVSATISLPRSRMSGEGRLNGAAGTLMVQVPGALGPEPLTFALRASGEQIEAEGIAGHARFFLRATRVHH